MDCKCGHYQFAHDYGRFTCNMPKCKCVKYREKPKETEKSLPGIEK